MIEEIRIISKEKLEKEEDKLKTILINKAEEQVSEIKKSAKSKIVKA